MNLICYQNGSYLPRSEVFLGVEDLAFTRGYAAYECLRAYGKSLFYFDEHMERLKSTLSTLFLPLPEGNIASILMTLIEKNPIDDLVFRMYVTGTGTFIILVDLPSPPTPEQLSHGVSVMTTPLPRTFPSVKSTNYTSAMVSTKQALSQGFYEALYLDDQDNLLELTKANFFAVVNGTLYTAKDNILHGITRNIVISLARQNNIPIVEATIPKSKIPSFSEAFLTNTTKEILAITQIDAFSIPRGPITDLLLDRFKALRCPPLSVR